MAEHAGWVNQSEGGQAAIPGPAVGHVVRSRVLVAVWMSLLILTVATVAAARVDFGAGANLWIAMAIATTKASLVLLYFMHLRYDHPVNAIVFIFALFFVALFIGVSLTDSEHYQADLIRGYPPEATR